MLGSQIPERLQGPAHAVVDRGADTLIQKGHDRIDDDQARLHLCDVLGKRIDLRRQKEQRLAVVAAQPPDVNPIEVGPEAFQPRPDRVRRAILAVQDQDITLRGHGAAVREQAAARDARAQVEGDERLAHAGIALQDGQLGQGQPSRPQPGDRSGRRAAQWE